MTNDTPDHDIIIVGGGLVGMSLLLSLPDAMQARALLVDAASEPDSARPGPPGLDDRGTALNRRSLSILHELGVLERVRPAMGDIRHIEVSQAGFWGITELSDHQPLGAVVSNRHLGAELWERLRRSPVKCRFRTTAESVVLHPGSAEVRFGAAGVARARLLILADGNRSGLGQRLGFARKIHDYGQMGITFNVDRSGQTDGRAYERFSPEGPRALLPLAGQRQSVVWTSAMNRHADLLARPDAWWRHAVAATFGTDQGRVTAVSARTSYPLVMSRASEIGRPRVVQLGNSAMTLHPVAGQGFNLHLRAAEQLARALTGTDDPGSRSTLTPWIESTDRAFDQMQHACHGLVKAFEPQSRVAGHLRGIGLVGLNALSPVRRSILELTLGYAHPPLNRPGVTRP